MNDGTFYLTGFYQSGQIERTIIHNQANIPTVVVRELSVLSLPYHIILFNVLFLLKLRRNKGRKITHFRRTDNMDQKCLTLICFLIYVRVANYAYFNIWTKLFLCFPLILDVVRTLSVKKSLFFIIKTPIYPD